MPKVCLYCARYDFEPITQEPLGIGYIASYLIGQKIIAEDEIRVVEDIDEAITFKPDILGVSSVSQVIQDARDFAKKYKEKFGCLTVLGGYHVSCIPEKMPEEFDIGVLGEGERTFAEIVSLFKAKMLSMEVLKQIKGICYRENGKVVINEPREMVEDINLIPWPYRYKVYPEGLSIFTSRGCPYRCIFCASSKFWRNRFRLRSARDVVSEMNYIVSKYQPKSISIMDDLWIFDKNRFREIVSSVIKLGIPEKVNFIGFCRSNIIGEEEIMLLKQMNFRYVRFGAETGSETLLKRLKGDNISIEDHQRVIDLCKKHNISCMGSFMFGVPGETEDDLKATINFLRKNKGKFRIGGFYFFNPLPGTEIWNWMKDRKMISDDFSFGNLKIDFMKRNFRWDKSMYFNENCVPYKVFQKYIKKIKTEFIDVKNSKIYLFYNLLKKILGRNVSLYLKQRYEFLLNISGKILVEVGPGDSPKEGYIHCDIRPKKHVEYVCNAWAIPFKSESVDEIYARHVLEHLTYGEARRALKHWLCVLKVGGRVDINVPDLERHIEQLNKDGLSPYVDFKFTNKQHAMAGIYGWQENKYDFHKWGYTFETLCDLLNEIGFSNIKRIEDDSISGYLNLRIIAQKEMSFPNLQLDSESIRPKMDVL